MKVLEKYQELIEAKADDISIWWKLLSIHVYLLSAISSYVAAILFYILWHNIFDENCPLWAEIVSPRRSRLMPDNVPIRVIPTALSTDWRRKIFIVYKHQGSCAFYHSVSLCSCLFSIAWLILFAICGKGGYDTRIVVAPWRVVPPALICQIIFAILTMHVVSNLEYGYSNFANNLEKIAIKYNNSKLITPGSQCDIVQHFFNIEMIGAYNICNIYPTLQIFSWIMACSWIIGIIILTLRVISISDFKLLTVTIRKIPKDQVHKYIRKRASSESVDSVHQ